VLQEGSGADLGSVLMDVQMKGRGGSNKYDLVKTVSSYQDIEIFNLDNLFLDV